MNAIKRVALRRLFAACPGGAKMLHETLCLAQSRVGNSNLDRSRQARDIARLQWLIGLVEGSGAYRSSR